MSQLQQRLSQPLSPSLLRSRMDPKAGEAAARRTTRKRSSASPDSAGGAEGAFRVVRDWSDPDECSADGQEVSVEAMVAKMTNDLVLLLPAVIVAAATATASSCCHLLLLLLLQPAVAVSTAADTLSRVVSVRCCL